MRIRSTMLVFATTGVTCHSLLHGVLPASSVIGLTILTLYFTFSHVAGGGFIVLGALSARITTPTGRTATITIDAPELRKTISQDGTSEPAGSTEPLGGVFPHGYAAVSVSSSRDGS